MAEKETVLFDYAIILFRQWKYILRNFIVVSVVAAAVSLVIPRWYRAHTTILPPAPEESLMGLSTILSDLPFNNLGIGAVSDEADRFLAILDSRTVMEAVAKKFDLQSRYKEKNMEETVRRLRKHVYAKIDDEKTITLGAEARTPYLSYGKKVEEARELARDMANYFIEKLDSVNAELKVERARNTRIFTERRYFQNLEELAQAEENLKRFQDEHGIIALPEQTTVTITAVAELKAQVIAKEVELNVLKRYVSGNHTDIQRAQNELNELKKKYDEYAYGADKIIQNDDTVKDSKDLFLPLSSIPDLGLQYVRLFREVKIQEKILEFLLPMYEEAKIQEAKDTPTVQVLDKAVKPFRKHRPKRAIIVIFWGFISLLYSSGSILFKPTLQFFFQSLKEKK